MTKSVFISSTSIDLQSHRAAVKKIIERLEMRPIDMKNFGSQPGDAVDVSLDQVRQADYFIGIIAHRYGYVPAGMVKSVTEQEYDEAVKRRIPRLMYLVDPAYEWALELKETDAAAQTGLAVFKARVEKESVRSLFTTPEDLAQQVATDLARLVQIRRRRNALLSGIGILFAVIGMFWGILLVDTGIRSDVIAMAGLGSATPTATPSPTPIPNLSGYDIGIAVSYFSISDNRINEQEADTLVRQINTQMKADMEAFGQQTDLTIGFIDPASAGRIQGDTPTERETNARAIAKQYGADIVLYGEISQNEQGLLEVQPEFFVLPESFSEALEMTGSFRLGRKIKVEGSLAGISNALAVNRPLSGRTTAISQIFGGLIQYVLEDYPAALGAFQLATAQDGWEETEGREVLYVLLGNTYGKIATVHLQNGEVDLASDYLDQAQQEFEQGVAVAQSYSRPYAGLAGVKYLTWNINTQATGLSDTNTLHEALAYLDQAARALDKPHDIGIQTKELATRLQIDYALWQYSREALTLTELESIYADLQNVADQIIRRYDNGANPSVQDLTAEAYAVLGLVSYSSSLYDEAVEQFEQAISLSLYARRRMFFYGWTGDCYMALNQPEAAITAFEEALAQADAAGNIAPSITAHYEESLTQLRGGSRG